MISQLLHFVDNSGKTYCFFVEATLLNFCRNAHLSTVSINIILKLKWCLCVCASLHLRVCACVHVCGYVPAIPLASLNALANPIGWANGGAWWWACKTRNGWDWSFSPRAWARRHCCQELVRLLNWPRVWHHAPVSRGQLRTEKATPVFRKGKLLKEETTSACWEGTTPDLHEMALISSCANVSAPMVSAILNYTCSAPRRA